MPMAHNESLNMWKQSTPKTNNICRSNPFFLLFLLKGRTLQPWFEFLLSMSVSTTVPFFKALLDHIKNPIRQNPSGPTFLAMKHPRARNKAPFFSEHLQFSSRSAMRPSEEVLHWRTLRRWNLAKKKGKQKEGNTICQKTQMDPGKIWPKVSPSVTMSFLKWSLAMQSQRSSFNLLRKVIFYRQSAPPRVVSPRKIRSWRNWKIGRSRATALGGFFRFVMFVLFIVASWDFFFQLSRPGTWIFFGGLESIMDLTQIGPLGTLGTWPHRRLSSLSSPNDPATLEVIIFPMLF